jgi:hypothetical protein
MKGLKMDYGKFIKNKSQYEKDSGFEPLWIPEFLFDFQKHLVTWSIEKGRSAIFADCGLGKTPMQLVWAENIVRKTNKNVLILTPLAVSYQTQKEANKFGIDIERSQDGHQKSKIVVTNYERLHYFDPDEYIGCVCDESSILKHYKGKIKAEVTEFMRRMPYRLCCTATAAPNDYWELGTSSEALGYLGFQDMLSRFFIQETKKDYLGWGRVKYRFRGHAEIPFWKWVCSWARVCRSPSDLGYKDDGFVLPPLVEKEHIVSTTKCRPGMLFSLPALDLQEQRAERRITIEERCEYAMKCSTNGEASVYWCHLNDEADRLESIIPDGVQVSGSMSDEKKEERLLAFQSGDIKKLITKPKIGCFGLNWQHCHNVVTFPSHSWEQYYQSIRRCWRYGQKKEVTVHIISTEGEQRVLQNLQRKARQAEVMFDRLCKYAHEALIIRDPNRATDSERIPRWL